MFCVEVYVLMKRLQGKPTVQRRYVGGRAMICWRADEACHGQLMRMVLRPAMTSWSAKTPLAGCGKTRFIHKMPLESSIWRSMSK